MDIKDLNKSQLILLAVLLSFVTSIATGITTVTLMQQAPTSFTVPVNRVIQQTVEKIQQVEGKTVTQTVVVKEEDLVVDAIAKNKEATYVVTKEVVDSDGKNIEASYGRAFSVSTDGVLVADGNFVSDKGTYYVKNDSGKFKATFISLDKTGFSFLKMGDPVDDKSKLAIILPNFGDFDKMKAGQKVIVLGNNISTLIFEGKTIDINATKANAGSIVLNIDGEVVGIILAGETSFVSIKSILESLKANTAPSTEVTPKV
jgi:hypothetical protein